MKSVQFLSFFVVALAAVKLPAEDSFDRIAEALTFSAFQDKVHARLSGLMDTEVYHFQQPAPGLISTKSDSLFNPRLSLFLDTQIGPHVYGFVQARFDRGFDPTAGDLQARLDEYAIRITPWEDGRLNLQVGMFGTVVGNWMERHLSWENPFIAAPSPYENPTAIFDMEPPTSTLEFLSHEPAGNYEAVPIIWGPSYATGASVLTPWSVACY
jgi:hypothetical protein